MARKKEIIQGEWDKAQEELVAALNKADKAKEEVTLVSKDVEDAQGKYDTWKKLLNESIAKIADWKNEKDKKRLEWMKFVETQKTKTDRNFVARIQTLWKDAAEVLNIVGGRKTLAETIGYYESDGVSKLKKVNELVKEIETAIGDRDAGTAISKIGIALNALKGLTGMSTKSGLNKMITNYAKGHKVTLKDVDVKDATLKLWFDKTSLAYNKLSEKIDSFEPQIAQLTEELANKEPETTSQDPEYKKHLKEIQTDYKEVLAFSLDGLNKVKKLQGDVQRLVKITETATAANADKMVEATVKIFEGLKREYKAVDMYIQETIRTTESTVTRKKNNYGITQDDQTKTLVPLMNRAFALNYQAKAIFETNIDTLRDVLEEMVEKFNNTNATSALGTVKMS